MEEFTLNFKDDTERIIIVLMLVLSIFAGFIPSILVILFCPNLLNENSVNFAKALFNFEITILIAAILFSIVHASAIVGLIGLTNIIILLMGLVSISKNVPIKLIRRIKIL